MTGFLGWLLRARILRHRFSLQLKSSAKPKPINEHQGSRTSPQWGCFARTGFPITRGTKIWQVYEIQELGASVFDFGQ
jgi:hypothetical protein